MLIPRDQPEHDRMHKIRPIIESLKKRFNEIPAEERTACDEQMCSSKARHFLIRYMPNKPHKYGFLLNVLSCISGFSYNLKYTGQEKEYERLPGEPDLRASRNMVARLARVIPENKNHKIYFDNYYTSIQPCNYLLLDGIHSVGTVRTDHIPNFPLPNKNQIHLTGFGKVINFQFSFYVIYDSFWHLKLVLKC